MKSAGASTRTALAKALAGTGAFGHSSIQLTVDTYGHLIPGANRQAVDRLDDAIVRHPDATATNQTAQ